MPPASDYPSNQDYTPPSTSPSNQQAQVHSSGAPQNKARGRRKYESRREADHGVKIPKAHPREMCVTDFILCRLIRVERTLWPSEYVLIADVLC